jgi:hypothetical protein
MTELATGVSPTPQSTQQQVETPVETAALITEEEVLFGTAAVAVPEPTTHRVRNAVHAVADAVRAFSASLEKPPARRHYPKRYTYLETSLMSREMGRL